MNDYLSEVSTETIIDSLPPNMPLYKDSGLWQVRSDDMEDVIIQQEPQEPFRDFLIRYAGSLGHFDTIDFKTNISLSLL